MGTVVLLGCVRISLSDVLGDPSALEGMTDTSTVRRAWEIIIDEQAEPARRSDLAGVIAHQLWDIDNATHRYRYDYYDALSGE